MIRRISRGAPTATHCHPAVCPARVQSWDDRLLVKYTLPEGRYSNPEQPHMAKKASQKRPKSNPRSVASLITRYAGKPLTREESTELVKYLVDRVEKRYFTAILIYYVTILTGGKTPTAIELARQCDLPRSGVEEAIKRTRKELKWLHAGS